MELPTYTSIWRIEKRLYKLYDFRLPMPLPVGQIIVFTAITVPYVILLTLLGLPFTHSLFWLYVLPPGVLTWLATRPVLESKRLPELIISQVRYLGEPPTWCRMAPLAEKDDIAVSGRVWRRSQQPAAEPAIEPVTVPAVTPAIVPAAAPAAVAAPAAAVAPAPAAAIAPATAPAIARPGEPPGRRRGSAHASGPATGPAQVPVRAAPGRPARAAPAGPARTAVPGAGQARVPPAVPGPGRAPGPGFAPASFGAPAQGAPPASAPATPPPVRGAPVPGSARQPGTPPVVVVPAQPSPPGAGGPGAPAGPGGPPTVRPRTVERALSGPADQRSTNWRDHVVLVPGGLGPGRPDHDKRDRARAVLPVGGSRLVAVLGCTVGAGQTVTTLILADLLASLRSEAVAALDLNPGPASLAGLAAPRPALAVGSLLAGPGSPAPPRGPGQLDVIAPEVRGDGALDMGDLEYRRIFGAAAARYGLTFADPGASAVARVLNAADQLVLVAPASPDAARALAMTQEWLGAHGYHALTANSITVVNGVSKRSMPHAEQAELVVRGRCRAIVRVPWDDHLAEPKAGRGIRDSPNPGTASRLGQLRPPVLQAYTALAGVLVAALAASPQRRRAPR